MCDTFVALAPATADGSVILGKNSDREPNEAHHLVLVPGAEHGDGARIDCTYISIAQAARTRTVLLAKPYWIWGAEMGVNDAGVAIGNEAVFTKVPREKRDGLLGMDLLRLALERAATAGEAAAVITELLTRHGQHGQAGHTHNLMYDNSFIIADPRGALVLETMGRDWVIREVAVAASISNAITTGRSWDRASDGITTAGPGIDVADRFSDFVYTTFSAARKRQCRTSAWLAAHRGAIGVRDAMALLRDHGTGGTDRDWGPDLALTGQTVCAHAGFGPIRVSQSTGSMVVQVGSGGTTAWVTGSSAPCTSIFKPVWLDTGLPPGERTPGRYFDSESRWWRHELLHRSILSDYPDRISVLTDERDAFEGQLVSMAHDALDAGDRWRVTELAFAEADALEQRWLAAIRATGGHRGRGRQLLSAPFRRAWRGFDAAARIPVGAPGGPGGA
jgi:dipeptidase